MAQKNPKLEREMRKYFQKVEGILVKAVREAFAMCGEEAVAFAKDRPQDESWYDHTGNLRSSIGYGLYEHGLNIITSSFRGAGAEGVTTGEKMIKELAEEYRDAAISLVVVAGMNYAEYVEAIDGKDVLASAELKAKSRIDGILRRAINNAEKEIERIPFNITITV